MQFFLFYVFIGSTAVILLLLHIMMFSMGYRRVLTGIAFDIAILYSQTTGVLSALRTRES